MKAIYFLLLFAFVSCKGEADPIYSKEIVHNMADYDFESQIPPPVMDIYVRAQLDSISITNLTALYHIHQKQYKSKNFENFLFKIMNHEESLKTCLSYYSSECFKPDKNIIAIYNKLGFNKLINKYCEKSSNRYIFKNQHVLRLNEINTIGYICYLNKYSLVLTIILDSIIFINSTTHINSQHNYTSCKLNLLQTRAWP